MPGDVQILGLFPRLWKPCERRTPPPAVVLARTRYRPEDSHGFGCLDWLNYRNLA
jgi:hypothetical protein